MFANETIYVLSILTNLLRFTKPSPKKKSHKEKCGKKKCGKRKARATNSVLAPPADAAPSANSPDATSAPADTDSTDVDPADAVLVDAPPADEAPVDAAPVDEAPVDAASEANAPASFFLKDICDRTICISDVPISSTVGSLKTKIQDLTAVPQELQRLNLGRKILDDDTATLESFGLKKDGYIRCMLGIRGGSKDEEWEYSSSDEGDNDDHNVKVSEHLLV